MVVGAIRPPTIDLISLQMETVNASSLVRGWLRILAFRAGGRS